VEGEQSKQALTCEREYHNLLASLQQEPVEE
jgi:hypothetical protein